VDITISHVYVNSTLQPSLTLALQVGQHGWLDITYNWAAGHAYSINIVTTRGTKVVDYYVAQ
jgi:hypothetical protein